EQLGVEGTRQQQQFPKKVHNEDTTKKSHTEEDKSNNNNNKDDKMMTEAKKEEEKEREGTHTHPQEQTEEEEEKEEGLTWVEEDTERSWADQDWIWDPGDYDTEGGDDDDVGDGVAEEPLVLPVTEGKKTDYKGLPKELMPIHPGGGSRFDDLEKEKLEKSKMAQTKGILDEELDSTDTATSHDAESLYSSAASLCVSSVILSLSSFRILI
ncbi:hypothetical protein Pmani_018254, partial [Petrolisthes manimaculis]